VPFFVAKPDENLVSYVDRRLIPPGAPSPRLRPGRNALYLAAQGFEVDAVDLSPAAIAWARDRAREASADINFFCADAFTACAGSSPTSQRAG
jgi:SAM-dependent methyltransferase